MKKLKKNNRDAATRRHGDTVKFGESFLVASILLIVLSAFGCQPNQTIIKDVATTTPLPTAETKRTSFEQDLRDMQSANFDYIFVFRRKDGGEFDKDDRKYLRENTPPETNRFVLTDDGKAFIAGSGFAFFPEQMTALQQRFAVEDYSKPEIKEAANKAANADANGSNKPMTNANNSNKQANK